MSDFILNWLINVPVFAAPLLLASLGLIVTARAGILNLGVEGLMAINAFSVLWPCWVAAVFCGFRFKGLPQPVRWAYLQTLLANAYIKFRHN
jgi:ABC-type uncharacterized transport system permease subunit